MIHPFRAVFALLMLLLTAPSARYVVLLRRDAQRQPTGDPASQFVTRSRFVKLLWIVVGMATFTVGVCVSVTVETVITWQAVVLAACSVAGWVMVALGARYSARRDAEFLELFGSRHVFFCTDLDCPYRAERMQRLEFKDG